MASTSGAIMEIVNDGVRNVPAWLIGILLGAVALYAGYEVRNRDLAEAETRLAKVEQILSGYEARRLTLSTVQVQVERLSDRLNTKDQNDIALEGRLSRIETLLEEIRNTLRTRPNDR